MKNVPLSQFPCGQLGLSPRGELWETVYGIVQSSPICVVSELGIYLTLPFILGRVLLLE